MVEYIQIQDMNMDCSKHTGEIKCAHYYCAICKHCNKIICHTCLLEEELFDLDLIYGDECISDDEDVGIQDEMPPLEPWTPTKK
jgi:hypothetical protein